MTNRALGSGDETLYAQLAGFSGQDDGSEANAAAAARGGVGSSSIFRSARARSSSGRLPFSLPPFDFGGLFPGGIPGGGGPV